MLQRFNPLGLRIWPDYTCCSKRGLTMACPTMTRRHLPQNGPAPMPSPPQQQGSISPGYATELVMRSPVLESNQ